jgi:ADP-heptose:LPS heptosyltransferase
MRQRRFDTAICTFPQDRFVLWAAASGARVRVGEAGQRFARLLNHRPAIAKDRGGVRRYYADLVSAVGAEVTDMHTEFSPSDGARRWAEEALGTAGEAGKRRIVAVHPGASGKFRVWPPERFSAVIDALHEEGRWTPVLVGSAFDREAMDRVADATRAPLLRVDCGESVDRLAALLAGCALLVSNDSGPRHLAIAVGVRSVACFPLFTDAAWKNYGEEEGSWIVQGIPPCPACSGSRCEDRIPDGAAFGSTCMRMIRAEDVLRRVRVILGGG